MVQYERFGHLVAIAILGRSNSIRQVPTLELSVRFSEYVKSQIHLNIVSSCGGPPLADYIKVYKSIEGGKPIDGSNSVLRRFYHDMAFFLINNANNVHLTLNTDTNVGSEVETFSISRVKSQLLSMLDNVGHGENLAKMDYGVIIDEILSIDDLKNKIDSYAAAAILLSQLSMTKVKPISIVK